MFWEFFILLELMRRQVFSRSWGFMADTAGSAWEVGGQMWQLAQEIAAVLGIGAERVIAYLQQLAELF